MLGDRRGNIIIEFALALPVLFLLLAGMADLGRFALQKSALLQGAREGAQYGMVNSTDGTGIESTAVNATGLTGVTATHSVSCECVNGTTVSCSTTCAAGVNLKTYVMVTTTKTFSSFFSPSALNFGLFGSWTPPTSVPMTASVTVSVP